MIEMIKEWIEYHFGDKELGAIRSPLWTKVRKEFITRNPECAVCGKTTDCEIHHKLPFHTHPELELRDSNLITLCREHHFLFGHLLKWSAINPEVENDATYFRAKIESR